MAWSLKQVTDAVFYYVAIVAVCHGTFEHHCVSVAGATINCADWFSSLLIFQPERKIQPRPSAAHNDPPIFQFRYVRRIPFSPFPSSYRQFLSWHGAIHRPPATHIAPDSVMENLGLPARK